MGDRCRVRNLLEASGVGAETSALNISPVDSAEINTRVFIPNSSRTIVLTVLASTKASTADRVAESIWTPSSITVEADILRKLQKLVRTSNVERKPLGTAIIVSDWWNAD
jgi:hypothetical protein